MTWFRKGSVEVVFVGGLIDDVDDVDDVVNGTVDDCFVDIVVVVVIGFCIASINT